jgi:gliding motility-associated-like protein
MTVEIRPSPVAGFSASSFTINLPSDHVLFENTSKGATSHSWSVSDGASANTMDYTHTFQSVGFYTVSLVVQNDANCFDSVKNVVTVIRDVKFPTAFTPNGDKLNDVFRLYTDGVVEFELLIFNRWGEMIFKSENLHTGWDGSFNGKICQQDAYVWKARIVFFDGREYDGTGSVTLLR